MSCPESDRTELFAGQDKANKICPVLVSGMKHLDNILIIGRTNIIEVIDPALSSKTTGYIIRNWFTRLKRSIRNLQYLHKNVINKILNI